MIIIQVVYHKHLHNFIFANIFILFSITFVFQLKQMNLVLQCIILVEILYAWVNLE